MKHDKKGFVIIVVMSIMAILVLIAAAIISISSSEAVQVRTANDTISAGYMAAAAAERAYAMVGNKWQSISTEQWSSLSIPETSFIVDGVTIGTFSANAYKTTNPREFNIVSVGKVNGRAITVTTKYGYRVDYSNGIPLASIGPISLLGHKVLWWKFMVTADGPIESASSIVPNGNADSSYTPNNRYVQYSGDVTSGASITTPSFWEQAGHDRFDTIGEFEDKSIAISHSNPDYITRQEAIDADTADTTDPKQGILAAFDANNVYNPASDNDDTKKRIDDKDGFYHYYTGYLNQAENNNTETYLNIGPTEANYRTGTTNLGPWGVGAGTNILFVDGDVNVIFNAQQYWTSDSDLTIVSMHDIFIAQPVNGPDDRLTLIAYNDIVTGGLNLGDTADVDGNLVLYAGQDFDAVLGGVTNGSIFAGHNITVDTKWLILYSSRDFNAGTDSWSEEDDWPLGLPSTVPVFERGYHMRTEGIGSDLAANYNPRWQKRKRD